jgi:hypothetical protein
MIINEPINTSFPLASLPAPKISSSNSIILDDTESVTELKEIVYSKNDNTFPKKLESIEKINDNNSIQETTITKITAPTKPELLYKNSSPQQITQQITQQSIRSTLSPIIQKNDSNPYIKKVNLSKFIKIKKNNNNSFYKKKYEENSANYNAIVESNKNITSLSEVSDVSNVSEVTMTTNNSSVPTINTELLNKYKEEIKNINIGRSEGGGISNKNKIILHGVSEDDEEDEDEIEI